MSFETQLNWKIAQVKRAAIDAYMKQQGWHVAGDYYRGMSRPNVPAVLSPESVATRTIGSPDAIERSVLRMSVFEDHYHVARPSVMGLGGGQEYVPPGFVPAGYDFTAQFESLRSQIESAVEPFRGGVVPGDLSAPLSECLAGEAMIYRTGDAGDKGTTLDQFLDSIDSRMPQLAGAFPMVFQMAFLDQLSATVDRIRGLAVVHCAALAQEQDLWARLEADLTVTLDAAREAFEEVHGTTFDIQELLTIGGYVVAGLDLVVSGGRARLALEGIALGLKILDESSLFEPSQDSETAQSFDTVLAGLLDTLGALKNGVCLAEVEISSVVSRNLDFVAQNAHEFEISRDIAGDYAESAHTIGCDIDVVQNIAAIGLAEVRAIVDEAAEVFARCDVATVLYRSGDLGSGRRGPSHDLYRSAQQIKTLLRKLSEEIAVAADALVAWSNDIEHHEGEAVNHIQGLLESLDASTRWDILYGRSAS